MVPYPPHLFMATALHQRPFSVNLLFHNSLTGNMRLLSLVSVSLLLSTAYFFFYAWGWVTLQLTRDSENSQRYFSARSVTGFLSDVYSKAADEVGKVHLIADERVQGAVFDLPEDIAKELLDKDIPAGNTISKVTKLPPLQDDGPPSDFYGKFSDRERNNRRGGSRDGRGFRSSRGWDGGRGSDDDFGDSSRRGGRSYKSGNSWSKPERSSRDDWLIGGRQSSRSSSSPNRSFAGTCFTCGESGHRASDCPNKRGDFF